MLEKSWIHGVVDDTAFLHLLQRWQGSRMMMKYIRKNKMLFRQERKIVCFRMTYPSIKGVMTGYSYSGYFVSIRCMDGKSKIENDPLLTIVRDSLEWVRCTTYNNERILLQTVSIYSTGIKQSIST